jgi:cold shock protein
VASFLPHIPSDSALGVAGALRSLDSKEIDRRNGVKGMSQLKGTVKWFHNAKGYGLIGSEAGPDVFVHYSSINFEGYKSLQEGDNVEFEIAEGPKGPQAANVKKAG